MGIGVVVSRWTCRSGTTAALEETIRRVRSPGRVGAVSARTFAARFVCPHLGELLYDLFGRQDAPNRSPHGSPSHLHSHRSLFLSGGGGFWPCSRSGDSSTARAPAPSPRLIADPAPPIQRDRLQDGRRMIHADLVEHLPTALARWHRRGPIEDDTLVVGKALAKG